MLDEGKYIYCLIDSQEERDFGSVGIGGRGDRIHTVVFEDIAVVVSDSPVIKYSISRENTMSHIKVMEAAMKDFTILPVKFGTIAAGNKDRSPEERVRLEILKSRYKELKDLLVRMTSKVELGLKAIWKNMEMIYKEIVDENKEIRVLRKRIVSGNPVRTHGQRVTLGEKVKEALDIKRAKEEEKILAGLKSVPCDICRSKIFGDSMITNSAFLVDKSQIEEFDQIIEKLESTYDGRTKFRYVGPVPPCNFVELVISLKGEEGGKKS